MRAQNGKRVSLSAAAALIPDGSTLALGGDALHRSPAAFARELGRRGASGLHLVKTAGAYDVDILCAARALSSVSAGYVGYESEFGQAAHYRAAVESGTVEAREHACYTIIAGLRAAAQGLGFLPVRGLDGSSLPAARGWKRVRDPYGGDEYVAIPAIVPDWAVVHAQEADAEGNARIYGPVYEDVLMAKAARNVIVIAERLVSGFRSCPESVAISGFMVRAVVLAPGGALPGSCAGRYGIDGDALRAFKKLSGADASVSHLAAWERNDRGGCRGDC